MNCENQSNSVYRHFCVDNFARHISVHDPNAQKRYPDSCHCGTLTLAIVYTFTLILGKRAGAKILCVKMSSHRQIP